MEAWRGRPYLRFKCPYKKSQIARAHFDQISVSSSPVKRSASNRAPPTPQKSCPGEEAHNVLGCQRTNQFTSQNTAKSCRRHERPLWPVGAVARGGETTAPRPDRSSASSFASLQFCTIRAPLRRAAPISVRPSSTDVSRTLSAAQPWLSVLTQRTRNGSNADENAPGHAYVGAPQTTVVFAGALCRLTYASAVARRRLASPALQFTITSA